MRLFVHLIDGTPQAWGLTDYAVRQLAPENVSFPAHAAQYEDVDLAEFGIETFHLTPRPDYNPMTHDCTELPPALIGGKWTQQWAMAAASAGDVAQRGIDASTQAREVAKALRAVAVENITVTTSNGNTFDGDETSQGRMARAIIALQAAGVASTRWVLADNSNVQATVAELSEALVLAGLAQSEVWALD